MPKSLASRNKSEEFFSDNFYFCETSSWDKGEPGTWILSFFLFISIFFFTISWCWDSLALFLKQTLFFLFFFYLVNFAYLLNHGRHPKDLLYMYLLTFIHLFKCWFCVDLFVISFREDLSSGFTKEIRLRCSEPTS